MKITAVVVTYNRKDLLENCLHRLVNQAVNNLGIIVVDNASTDGTKDVMQKWIKRGVYYYDTGGNLGGAGGFQYGLKMAEKLGYEYAWLMDDDTLVGKNTLKELINADHMLAGNYGFLASVPLWIDGSLCELNRPKPVHQKQKEVVNHQAGLIPIYRATFVSFFVKISIVKKVGLPIKEFFIWGDDVEYSQRISQKYPCFLVKKSQVVHATKNNIGSNIAKDNLDRISRYQYAYRNEIYVAKEMGIKGIIRQMAKILYHCVQVLFLPYPDKFKKIKVILSSSFRGLYFNPAIEFLE